MNTTYHQGNLFSGQYNNITPPKWVEYMEKNPHIYKAFKEHTLNLISKGRKYYSARTIIHHMRFMTDTREVDSHFKISDHVSPYLARRFEKEHPQYEGFFRKRPSRADQI